MSKLTTSPSLVTGNALATEEVYDPLRPRGRRCGGQRLDSHAAQVVVGALSCRDGYGRQGCKTVA